MNLRRLITFVALFVLTFIIDFFILVFVVIRLTENISADNQFLGFLILFWLFLAIPILVAYYVVNKYFKVVNNLVLIVSSLFLFSFSVFASVLYYQPTVPQYTLVTSTVDEVTDYTPSPTTIPGTTPYPTVRPSPAPRSVVKLELPSPQWLEYPKVTKLDIFDTEGYEGCYPPKDAKFHQTANFPDGSSLYNAYLQYNCGMGESTVLQRFVKKSDGSLYLINRESSAFQDSELTQVLKPEISFATVDIPGIFTPSQIALEKGLLIHGYQSPESFVILKSPQLLTTSEFGRIYLNYNQSGQITNLYHRDTVLRLKDDTISYYNLQVPFIKDDFIPMVTWNDGNTNKLYFEYGIRGGGCGGVIGNIIKSNNLPESDITPSGKTSDGQTVYKITNSNNSYLKAIYKYFVDTRTEDDQFVKDTPYSKFVTLNTHFLWKDGIGDWQLFVSQEFTSQAECAKPVIYLYPTTDTHVSVKVGADITQSEPQYPSKGWQVLAQSTGNLIYQNQNYPYLFWEGKGVGEYPDYRNRGIVVPQQELLTTLTKQLTQLGLNPKESADFLEFWTPKLPDTPYVRLTWLTTNDMDKLAPLGVNPVPTSRIRVFLEFQGLQKPIKLTPQKLTAPKRTGFTLVEWGGLLIK